MKILLVTEYFPPRVQGGGEISAYLLAKNLVNQGVEVHVLTSRVKGMDEFEHNKDGIKIHRMLTTGEDPSTFTANIDRELGFTSSIIGNCVKSLLKYYNFDIIHSLNSTSIYGVSKLKGKKVAHINSPLVFCPKGNLIYKGNECDGKCNYCKFTKCMLSSKEIGKMKNRFYLKYNPIFWQYIRLKQKRMRKALNFYDYVLPISDYLKNKLVKDGIKEDKLTTLANIVEIEKFSYKKTKGKFKILYLGAYIESKGVWDLLKALKGVNFEYECNFYGEGILKQELKNYVKKNKLNVKINYKTTHIPEVINWHDIVVVPSIVPEAFGRVVIETMASGKIIIARARGGLKELIIHCKTGLLFDSVEELKLQLNLISKINLFNKNIIMKEAKKYSGKIIAKKTIKIYKKVLKCQNK